MKATEKLLKDIDTRISNLEMGGYDNETRTALRLWKAFKEMVEKAQKEEEG